MENKVAVPARNKDKIRIWFNQTLSATYSIIEALKQSDMGDRFEFITSSRRPDHAYLKLGDISFIEPEESDVNGSKDSKYKNYVEYALSMALEHNVDIFIPKRHLREIAEHKRLFEEHGIHVLCNSFDSVETTAYKSKVYERLSGTDLKNFLPTYRVVETPEQMQDAIREYLNWYSLAVIKADNDEGGDTVRFIQKRIRSNYMTFDYGIPNRSINSFEVVESYRYHLERIEGGKKPFIVMQYLTGPEISVDCYIGKNMENPIAISRVKTGRTQIVGDIHTVDEFGEAYGRQEPFSHKQYEQPSEEKLVTLEELAIQIGRELGLTDGIYNVQFMWDGTTGCYKLTDVNPRTSGGMYMTLMTGVNPVEYAIKDILNETGEPIKYENNVKRMKVGKVERAVII